MNTETMFGMTNIDYGHGYWMAAHNGPLSWILWVLAILAVAYVFTRLWHGRQHDHGAKSNALNVLAERFANGEIDESEFREKRAILRSRH